MKKICYIILSFCILCFFTSFFNIISELKNTNRFGELKELDKSFPLSYGNEVYLLDNETILIENKEYGVVQAFNTDGDFVWGVQMATTKNTDANCISYHNNKLYLMEGYTKTIYEFTDFKSSYKILCDEILSDTEFYKLYPWNSESGEKCKLTFPNKISLYNSSGEILKSFNLKTDFKLFTYTTSFVTLIISAMMFWLIKNKFFK